MRIDLTCPVELWHFQMPTREYPVCTVQLYNLSEKAVVSIQACFLCYDVDGEQIARHIERIQSLDAPVRCAFEMSAAVEEGVDADGMELIIEKVWFEDGTVWRRGTNEMAEYEPSVPADEKRLAVLQHLAGADASCYPSDQGAVWVCVCGRANMASADQCKRCLRDKHDIFTSFNEAEIEKVLFAHETAQEEKRRAERAEEIKRLEEKEAKDKKKKYLKTSKIS